MRTTVTKIDLSSSHTFHTLELASELTSTNDIRTLVLLIPGLTATTTLVSTHAWFSHYMCYRRSLRAHEDETPHGGLARPSYAVGGGQGNAGAGARPLDVVKQFQFIHPILGRTGLP